MTIKLVREKSARQLVNVYFPFPCVVNIYNKTNFKLYARRKVLCNTIIEISKLKKIFVEIL